MSAVLGRTASLYLLCIDEGGVDDCFELFDVFEVVLSGATVLDADGEAVGRTGVLLQCTEDSLFCLVVALMVLLDLEMLLFY